MHQQLISGFVPRFSIGFQDESLWVALLSELGCFDRTVVFEVSESAAYSSYPKELAVRPYNDTDVQSRREGSCCGRSV